MDTPQQREGIVVAPNIIMVDLMEESIYIYIWNYVVDMAELVVMA